MKEISMKLSDYVQIKRPTYTILKIKPHKSIRNYNSRDLAKIVSKIYIDFSEMIIRREKKLIIQTQVKCSYYIEVKKNEVNFYFIVPNQYESLARKTITTIWKQAAISQVEELESFSTAAYKYEIRYKYEDALSVNIDKTNNYPLNNILDVVEIMHEGDRVGIFYNFTNYRNKIWTNKYKKTIKKFKNDEPLEKDLTLTVVLRSIGKLLDDVCNLSLSIINDFLGGSNDKKKKDTELQNTFRNIFDTRQNKELTAATKAKKNATVLRTQMLVISDSDDNERKKNIGIAACNAYNSICDDADNSLIYRRRKKMKEVDFMRTKLDRIEGNIMSVEECSNLLQLPGKTLIEQYKIDSIEILETRVFEELMEGYIRLGVHSYKNNETNCYMCDKGEFGRLALTILGIQGSGKTIFLGNYIKDIAAAGEGAIVLDYIKNCELANRIKKLVDPNKIVEIDLSKREDIQAFGFNEVKHIQGQDRVEYANFQTQLMLCFIDSINVSLELKARMRRSIASACNVVFLFENTSLREVVDCLQDHRKRIEYINMIPQELRAELQDDIYNLEDMHEYGKNKEDKGKIIGTKDSKLDFIMDRIALLTEDVKLKRMFNKPMSENLDFVEMMDQGKIVLIKMPDSVFNTDYHKNILGTFYIAKVWLASQIRGSMYAEKDIKRCHFLIDEIYHAKTAEYMIKDKLSRFRKYNLKFVLSAHSLDEISIIKNELKDSGSSYMLLQGTDERNFKELETDLAPYSVDDLTNLKQFHSLNLMKCSKGYETFITKLPSDEKND